MEREVIPGQIYKHFKNKLYQIVTVARHSETKEMLVIYQQLYGDFEIYARPLEMFMSEVDHEKYPDVTQKYRFELLKKNSVSKFMVDESNFEKKEKDVLQEEASISDNNTFESDYEKVNPYLLRFLDAETFEEKRNILIQAKNEIDDRLIDDIAVSIDVTIDEGELSDRFNSLLQCVDTFSKYEVNRFR